MNYFSPDEWIAVKTISARRSPQGQSPRFPQEGVWRSQTNGAKPFVTDTAGSRPGLSAEVQTRTGSTTFLFNALCCLPDGLYGTDNIMVKAGDILGRLP